MSTRGLLGLVRLEATLSEGRLISKAEALDRLDRFGVPAWLGAEMRARRQGETPRLAPWQRVRRARAARRIVRRSMSDLSARAARAG
jgi:hypothetical protein